MQTSNSTTGNFTWPTTQQSMANKTVTSGSSEVVKGSRAAGYADSVEADSTTLENDSSDGIEDRFLKLLVAQVRNQDPMDPMDNAQFTSQLAQISTVRGIETLNQTMKDFASSQVQSAAMSSLGLLGKQVLVPGDGFNYQPVSGQTTRIGFELDSAATAARIDVLDANGNLLVSRTMSNLDAGMHTFDWDGKDGSGRAVAAGTLQVQALAVDGTTAVDVETLVPARVMGVAQDSGKGVKLELDGPEPIAPGEVRVFL